MRKTVALLDSDVHQRMQLTMALQGTYIVQSHGGGRAAIATMQSDLPDVIVLGNMVGEASGLSVARNIKRDRRLGGVPLIYLAERQDTRLRDELLLIGVKGMLIKPFDPRTLMAAIEEMVNAQVETTWRDLPPQQRKVLEGSLSAFNGVARDLASGKPPEIGPVTEACSSLIEVVAQEELGPLLEKIRSHDNFTYVHSMRFSAFMALFARSIGLPKPMQIQVASGGLLHDMGMMTIPPNVLHKQEALTPNEWRQVRNHVTMGVRLLQAMGQVNKGVEIIVAQHHERLDGSGYPNGLKAGELNELARMAGIIDVFCGLTDRRPYKDPLTAHAALEIMATSMGGQLAVEMVPRFRDILLDTVYKSELETVV